jgi:AraC-like DNA-binding protein
MWPRDGTVLAVSSRALVGACDRLGVDAETLLRTVGIQRRTLEDPDARLQNLEASALWAKAYELSGDPVLSLHAAEACPLGAYKVIDYMASSARTVGEAFRYAARYFKLINTAVRLKIDESGDPAMEIGYLLGFADQSAFHHAFKRWTGCTPRQARTHAMYAKPASPNLHRRCHRSPARHHRHRVRPPPPPPVKD